MSIVYFKINNPVLTDKMASFDYDQTLVIPKDSRPFPKDINDYQELFPNIGERFRELDKLGYTLVIFTNQSKDWKCEQIRLVAQTWQVPIYICIARNKPEYKPNPLMFDKLVGAHYFDKDKSFFVGDALGRPGDWADTDKTFAQAIGVNYTSPEAFFNTSLTDILPKLASQEIIVYNPVQELKLPNIQPSPSREIIIMCGYPGAGKSTISEKIFEQSGYFVAHGDIYKTPEKMIKAASDPTNSAKSIVFDATNGTKAKRKLYVDYGTKLGLPKSNIRCIYLTMGLEDAYKQNKLRASDKQVPKIAYSVYKKHFEEPDESEGFTLLRV